MRPDIPHDNVIKPTMKNTLPYVDDLTSHERQKGGAAFITKSPRVRLE